MKTKNHVLTQLKKVKAAAVSIGIDQLGLFGSYARNEQQANSDIDILIHFKPEQANYANFLAICTLLEDSFSGEKIEIVTRAGLSPHLESRILEEVTYV